MKKLLFYLLISILISSFSIGCGKAPQPVQTAPASITPESTQVAPVDKPPAGSETLGAKLSGTYAEMMKKNKYLMKYKMTSEFEGKKMEVEATVAVSGQNVAVTSLAEGIKTTFLSKDNKTYMVNHSEKVVIEIPQGSAMADGMDNEIGTDGLTYVSSGVEDGLAYEKYSTTDGGIKYYFEGKKLVKIVLEVEGKPLVMNILEMSDNVPDIMFEVPSDYEKTTLPG